jgi:hypothetical protein
MGKRTKKKAEDRENNFGNEHSTRVLKYKGINVSQDDLWEVAGPSKRRR